MIIELLESKIRHKNILEGVEVFSRPVLIASFPKCGNTWFRFINSNILKINTQGINYAEPIDFHELIMYSPELPFLIDSTSRRELSRLVKDNPIFLKTHFYCNRQLASIPSVVLFRDPESALKSYYRYSVEELGLTIGSFKKFVSKSRFGIDYWKLFHRTWLDNKEAIFLDFDKMKLSPEHYVEMLYQKLGFDLDYDVLRLAVENSTIEAMSKIEQDSGDPRKKNKDYRFVKSSSEHIKSVSIEPQTRDILNSNGVVEVYNECKRRHSDVFG